MCLLCPRECREGNWQSCYLTQSISTFKNPLPSFDDNLVRLGTDGANEMLGARNSVMSRLRCKQPALIALHCHCHIAALIANEACRVLLDELEDLTTDVWYYFQKRPRRLVWRISEFCGMQATQVAKSMPNTVAQPWSLCKSSCRAIWSLTLILSKYCG